MFPRTDKLRVGLCIEKAQGALAEYAKGHPPIKPPVRIESVAEWMGFQVILLHTVGEEFSGLVSVRQKLIGVNGRHHRHRRRFTIGHELAHILLKHPPESHCTPGEIALYNAEADKCAAELLMPTPLLVQWLSITRSISNLAYNFDVSEEAMGVKMRQLKPHGMTLPAPMPIVVG
ncbi:MAG: ImmA/IrrE family metallo-endopeptidase [Bacteroidota bacterium]|mgnify:CR=1 FL=1